ncbi:Cobalt-precorrin-6x reductase [hydrothermal vent metagenome]|uniref:Cobalt-precorrin-6x reductase n=1 Tax=hydrothermal vent metagenome TaxID=652676 RepID=A0A3B0TBP1_9ZZZZ
MKVLVLGGTQEGLVVAEILHNRRHRVITSLAGLTSNPKKPKGKVISGGFGGASGLAKYLKAHKIGYLIDATHPFSVQMSQNAIEAAMAAKVPMVRLVRPPFEEPDDANWWRVNSLEEAAKRMPVGSIVFLTVGRQNLAPFIKRKDVLFLVRSIEVPEMELPDNFKTIQGRPPFSRGEEIVLMNRENITHLVAKDSGSLHTGAKLEAAYMLRVQVIMVNRPALPPAPEVNSVAEIEAIFDQLPAPKSRFFFLP